MVPASATGNRPKLQGSSFGNVQLCNAHTVNFETLIEWTAL